MELHVMYYIFAAGTYAVFVAFFIQLEIASA